MCADTATFECAHCGLPLRYFPDPDPTDVETSDAWCGIADDGCLEQACYGATAEYYPCPTCWGTGAYVDADMRGEMCDACDGAKLVADHAPMPVAVEAAVVVAHSLFSVSEQGLWRTSRCTCVEGVDHVAAVA